MTGDEWLAFMRREIYDGRDRLSWPGLIHVRVRPTWIRYSDFNRQPPEIVELLPAALERPAASR